MTTGCFSMLKKKGLRRAAVTKDRRSLDDDWTGSEKMANRIGDMVSQVFNRDVTRRLKDRFECVLVG